MTITAGRLKPVFAMCVSGLCFWILSEQVLAVSWGTLQDSVFAISIWQWALALCATFLSFLAMGEYDVLWHDRLKTKVPAPRARVTGMATLAISQTVGVGTVTGTFLRWHMLDPLPFRQAAAVTIAICLSFLACWTIVASLTSTTFGVVPLGWITIGLLGFGGALFVLIRNPRLRPDVLRLPKLISLTYFDLFFAAVAFWILLPAPGAVSFPTAFAALVLAIGAGLLSNAPAGLGAFDLVLVAFLPTIPDTDILATIIAFRLVYYILPALCGAAVLAHSHVRRPTQTPHNSEAPHSDLCLQGAKRVPVPGGHCVVRKHLTMTVALDTGSSDIKTAFDTIDFNFFYKCDARLAARAKRHGWVLRRIASEAIIKPGAWSLDGPKCSQLRRKLRQAEKAGISISRRGPSLPSPEMDQVASEWRTAHGGELGYSMGRYTPDYVAQQYAYLIRDHTDLLGFVTVQTRDKAWAVDLIRHRTELPHGAMHAAIARILSDAAAADVATVSLGAVPDGPDDNAFQRHCIKSRAGLRQFKAAFDPRWEPRYHAARSRLGCLASLLMVLVHVHRPWARLLPKGQKTVLNLIKNQRIIHLPHIIGCEK